MKFKNCYEYGNYVLEVIPTGFLLWEKGSVKKIILDGSLFSEDFAIDYEYEGVKLNLELNSGEKLGERKSES